MAQQEEGTDDATVTFEISRIRSSREELHSKKESLKEQLRKFNEVPTITIKRVVDPDINNHHIYALLELSNLSQVYLKAKYTLTPITNLQFANKRHIDEDIARAKELAGEEANNLAYSRANLTIMELIRKEKAKRDEQ